MAENAVTAICPRYHHAVELIGRRWNGAIVRARRPDGRYARPGDAKRLWRAAASGQRNQTKHEHDTHHGSPGRLCCAFCTGGGRDAAGGGGGARTCGGGGAACVMTDGLCTIGGDA